MGESNLLEVALYRSDAIHRGQESDRVEISYVVQPINDNSEITNQLKMFNVLNCGQM